MKGLFISTALFSILFFSCESNKGPCIIDPPSQELPFSIVDSSMNNLVGYDKTYVPDSITLYNDFDTVELEFFRLNDSIVDFDLWSIIDDAEYYLRLNHLDTDTLRLDLKRNITECYTYYTVDKFYFNHNEIFYNPHGVFVLIK